MAYAVEMQPAVPKKANATISKQKFKVYNEGLTLLLEERDCVDLKDDILKLLFDSFGFDPELKCYDREKVQQRCLDSGKSVYEMYTRKYYEKNKDDMDRKAAERMRLVRLKKKEERAQKLAKKEIAIKESV